MPDKSRLDTLRAETIRTLVESVAAQDEYGAFLDGILTEGLIITSSDNPLDDHERLRGRVTETQQAYQEAEEHYQAARRAG